MISDYCFGRTVWANLCLPLLGLALGATSCGKGIDTPAILSQCDSSLTFDVDIAPIISRSGTGRCAECHSGRYDTRSGIENDRGDFLQNIKNGSMPPGGGGFQHSNEGSKVIAWASCAKLK